MLNLNYLFAWYLLVNLFFLDLSSANDRNSSMYTVDPIINGLTLDDIGTYSPLSSKPPKYLYHWISFASLEKLFSNTLAKKQKQMPLKLVGTHHERSIIAQFIPDFVDYPGLFTWHNPIAMVGGSNEVYGNGEALLELKINPDARMGVFITGGSNGIRAKSPNDSIYNYDLILHINATDYDNKVMPIYTEWVVLNPESVQSVKSDPDVLAPKLETYARALDNITNSEERKNPKNKDLSDIELIAGTHHNGYLSWGLDSHFIRDRIQKLLSLKDKVPSFLKGDGLTFPRSLSSGAVHRSCYQFYRVGH